MLNKTGLFSHTFLGAGSVSRALIHVTDWLPTFYSAAGGTSGIVHIWFTYFLINFTLSLSGKLGKIDGIDQWDVLVRGSENSNRKRMLYNIDPLKEEKSKRGNGENAAIR